ncbi:MAG: bifunctional (p)ppGpp synthetase/guanosine-3',5'-bis(diphosphate) 3'-pyrophosphohydrolase [Granulosicoccaceae bacterium]
MASSTSSNASGDSRQAASDKPELVAYSVLLDEMKSRFNSEQIAEVTQAYTFARDAHEGQTRSSGEPYITHPIAVARIALEMQLDHYSVMSALLHDVLEDTRATREELVNAFSDEVATIVDGLSKLNYLEFKTKEEAQAESFRKMLLAMVTDLRVILIKLADRLHNMRTIDAISRERQKRIARETLEVYSPIADRLGMFKVKNELEDLGFRTLYPMRSRVLDSTVTKAHRNRDQLVKRIEERITASLGEKGILAIVAGREKHLYSLYNKMLKKQLLFQQVFDMFALRVVVASEDECYQVLGIIHKLYKPIFKRFKDYIAVPKANGYQSLHTVLNYVDGIPVEVQIRTREMDEFAESGVAAHWAYKNNDTAVDQAQTPYWLANLLSMHSDTRDTIEFVESVKVDLFSGEIYVFTPKGKIIQLPRDATPVDFAYAVHSDVGNTCVGAKVDRVTTALNVPLESGQTVEIETSPSELPSPMWLNFVVTAKARTAIRHFLRNLDQAKAQQFGQRLVERALSRYEHTLADVPDKDLNALLAEFHFKSIDDLFIDVGLGNHLPSQIAQRLLHPKTAGDDGAQVFPTRDTAPLLIGGREGSVVSLSKCCSPIPGDHVQGFITAGQGVAVHRAGCRNVRRFRRRPKEWVAVEWAPDISDVFEAEVTIQLMNQPGALARVTSTMSLMNVNIEQLDFKKRGEDDIQIRFVLSVSDRLHLARIIRRLRNLTVVRGVKRDR